MPDKRRSGKTRAAPYVDCVAIRRRNMILVFERHLQTPQTVLIDNHLGLVESDAQ